MIGVIADDLTGAAELGALGLRRGLRSEVRLLTAAGRLGRDRGTRADLICVDTDSRVCEPAEAARRAAAAARWLQRAGANWIYKKVDSVLRGHVATEVTAVMRQLGLRRALLLPANPKLGRTLKDGRYFVRGQPLDQTEFARDPEHPRRTAIALNLLGTPDTVKVCNCGTRDILPDTGIILCEAASSHAVRHWAARQPADALAAGGAEFFGALLEEIGGSARKPILLEPPTSRGELFVCGSASRATRQFVTAERRRGTPVFSLPNELAWGANLTPAATAAVSQRIMAASRTLPRVIIHVGLPRVPKKAVARRLHIHLAEIVERVLRRRRLPLVFAEGGSTAVELARRMGWSRLRVVRELAPGVATLAVAGRAGCWFTIKPGSYAWPASFRLTTAVPEFPPSSARRRTPPRRQASQR